MTPATIAYIVAVALLCVLALSFNRGAARANKQWDKDHGL